ncbi:MAG: hypothetical protein N2D54_00940 [Chloroflexota bacterium]
MSDLFDDVTADQDPFKKLASKIPGFGGYIERQNRRAADKILRELIAEKYTELWKKTTNLQQDLASAGDLMHLDEIETAAVKLQTFTDKVANASYGYSGFFDSEKINEEELAKMYEFDTSMLDMVDGIDSAIENVLSSVGGDGMPAAVRHLVGLSRDVVDVFESRDAVITALDDSEAETTEE